MKITFKLTISLEDVIITDFDPDMCTLVCLFSYFIYKEWILYNEDKKWKNVNILTFIKWELRNTTNIYGQLGRKWEKMCHLLESVVTCIENVSH